MNVAKSRRLGVVSLLLAPLDGYGMFLVALIGVDWQ